MKFILILFLLFSKCLGQVNSELYILYDDNNLKNRISASDQIELFQFSLNAGSEYKKILGFNKDGQIEVQNLIVAKSLPTFRFIYSNIDGKNPRIEVDINQVKQLLHFSDLEQISDAQNLIDVLMKFEKIYMVKFSGNMQKGIRTEVRFESLPGL